jgi:predicted RNA binding protein YcfA (HicA-like mRNA interferase family)
VPRIAGINHLRAVAAFERAGFRVIRQGKHVIMSDGERRIVIPRNNPINSITMGAIAREAGMTPDEFRRFL